MSNTSQLQSYNSVKYVYSSPIPVRITNRYVVSSLRSAGIDRQRPHIRASYKSTNCIKISIDATVNRNQFVPLIMLSNTMSLVPKLDEVQEFLLKNNVDIGFITETWLKDRIFDSVVNIQGYTIYRKDRSIQEHGGVCIYIKDHIKHEIPNNLQCCDEHEIFWIKLHPTRRPRRFSCIIAAVVYPPPASDIQSISNHLFQSLSAAESMFPNCGLIVAGDFNRLNTSSLQRHFKLKQLVKSATRGQAILDLILTNMSQYFSSPEISPPFGLSDHNTVLLKPEARVTGQSTRKLITVRDMRDSRKMSLGRYLGNVDWSIMNSCSDCDGKLAVFEELVKIGFNHIMPEKTMKVYPKDAPWISTKIKQLIRLRQRAFHFNKEGTLYKFYRNAVNKERKLCRAKYYVSKVRDLKEVNPRQWWKEVKS